MRCSTATNGCLIDPSLFPLCPEFPAHFIKTSSESKQTFHAFPSVTCTRLALCKGRGHKKRETGTTTPLWLAFHFFCNTSSFTMFECNVANSNIFWLALGADASNWLQKNEVVSCQHATRQGAGNKTKSKVIGKWLCEIALAAERPTRCVKGASWNKWRKLKMPYQSYLSNLCLHWKHGEHYITEAMTSVHSQSILYNCRPSPHLFCLCTFMTSRQQSCRVRKQIRQEIWIEAACSSDAHCSAQFLQE